MTDDFWGPIYEKCQNNLKLLKLICLDIPDREIVDLIYPNPRALMVCKPYLKKKKITNKSALAQVFVNYAANEKSLREILFYTWLQRNPEVMKFPPLPIDENSIKLLESGKFGNAAKIKILSFIDPRDGAKPVYEEYLLNQNADEEVPTELVPPQLLAANNDENQKQHAEIKRFEKEIATIRKDLKELQKKLKQCENNEKKSVRLVNEKSQELNSSKDTIIQLEKENSGLNIKLKAALEEVSVLSDKLAKNTQTSTKKNIPEKIIDLEEFKRLKESLAHKDKKVARIEAENQKLKSLVASDKEKDKQIQRLKDMLENYNEEADKKLKFGQIKSVVRHKSNQPGWFFYSFDEDILRVRNEVVTQGNVIDSEYCKVVLDKDNKVISIESIEVKNRNPIIGTYEKIGDKNFLISGENKLEIMVPLKNDVSGKPARGVFLNEFGDRRSGIYSLIFLKENKVNEKEQLVVTLKEILNFLKIIFTGNPEDLSNLLTELNISHSQVGDKFTFEKDFKTIFTGIRGRLPIKPICNDCVKKGKDRSLLFSRKANDNERCAVCNNTILSNKATKKTYNFNGSSILIVGGDYVGTVYEDRLSDYNLKVKWLSGFSNLTQLKSGLGRVDAVVIILKQLSHTVLREIVPIAESEGVQLIYCQKRGVSGVLECLEKKLKRTSAFSK